MPSNSLKLLKLPFSSTTNSLKAKPFTSYILLSIQKGLMVLFSNLKKESKKILMNNMRKFQAHVIQLKTSRKEYFTAEELGHAVASTPESIYVTLMDSDTDLLYRLEKFLFM